MTEWAKNPGKTTRKAINRIGPMRHITRSHPLELLLLGLVVNFARTAVYNWSWGFPVLFTICF